MSALVRLVAAVWGSLSADGHKADPADKSVEGGKLEEVDQLEDGGNRRSGGASLSVATQITPILHCLLLHIRYITNLLKKTI